MLIKRSIFYFVYFSTLKESSEVLQLKLNFLMSLWTLMSLSLIFVPVEENLNIFSSSSSFSSSRRLRTVKLLVKSHVTT